MNIKKHVMPVTVVIVLLVSVVLGCPGSYANDAATSAVVRNTAPAVVVTLTPDDDLATPGVQVINSDPTTNKTVTITAYARDMNGYDDLCSVTANITGPSIVEDSPVSLCLAMTVNDTTATYNGYFNLSCHTEGEYEVAVTATDSGGSTGVATMNFSYQHDGTVVTVYNYETGASTDKWAYRYQHKTKPPNTCVVPHTEFTLGQYQHISQKDWQMQLDRTTNRGKYATHRFKIEIVQPADTITQIDLVWNGLGYKIFGENGATLYVWNHKTDKYKRLDGDNSFITTLNGQLNKDIANYLSDDCITLVVVQNSPQTSWGRFPLRSVLGTDYLKLEVTHNA